MVVSRSRETRDHRAEITFWVLVWVSVVEVGVAVDVGAGWWGARTICVAVCPRRSSATYRGRIIAFGDVLCPRPTRRSRFLWMLAVEITMKHASHYFVACAPCIRTDLLSGSSFDATMGQGTLQ